MQDKMLPLKSLQTGRAGVDFKYTAPGMPQQNSCIKRMFSTLFNWECAMPNIGKFNAYF